MFSKAAPDWQMAVYSVLIIEDDEITRNRLIAAVNSDLRLRVEASFGNYSSAIKYIQNDDKSQGYHLVNVAIVDLGLPDGNGIDLIKAISRCAGNVESMVLTVFADESHVIGAIEAGATGYLLKDGDTSYITASIIDLLNGGSPISPMIARRLLGRLLPEAVKEPETAQAKKILTKREEEVLEYISRGYTFSEIAGYLNLSAHTVTTHVKHIYRKLSVHSRSEAVFEAINLGLVKVGN